MSDEKIDKPFQWLMLTIIVLVLASCVSGMLIVGEAKTDDTKKAFVSGVYAKAGQLKSYFDRHKQFPLSMEEVGVKAYQESDTEIFDGQGFTKLTASIEIVDDKIVISFSGVSEERATLILEPVHKDGTMKWHCSGGTLEAKYRIDECKK